MATGRAVSTGRTFLFDTGPGRGHDGFMKSETQNLAPGLRAALQILEVRYRASLRKLSDVECDESDTSPDWTEYDAKHAEMCAWADAVVAVRFALQCAETEAA